MSLAQNMQLSIFIYIISNSLYINTKIIFRIGNELAKYLDGLGFHVFAGCLDTSSEGAQRLRVECSPFLKLVNMDVTRDDHVQHAVQYVRDNLPAGEQGKK